MEYDLYHEIIWIYRSPELLTQRPAPRRRMNAPTEHRRKAHSVRGYPKAALAKRYIGIFIVELEKTKSSG